MVAPPAAPTRRRDASVLLLTEDSARDALETVKAIVHRAFGLLVDGYQSHRVAFEPPQAVLLNVLRANRWKEFRKDERLRNAYLDLLRTIATTLLQHNGFVVFHFDGDRRWSECETSENAAKFERLIRLPVQQILVSKVADPAVPLARLFVLVPFYSIEAWLYQNTRRAIALCRAHHGGADVARFEEWSVHPEALDEVVQVKTTTCLGAEHNLVLARDLDAGHVYGVGKSFAASVDRMLNCTALTAALLRTKES